MEVAAALLDASRKLSLGNTSNSNVSNISDSSWDSSMNETTDKTRELPGSSLWLGHWAKRSRSYSESSCPSSTNPTEKLNATAWLGGWQIPNRNSSSNTQQTPNNTPNFTSGFLFPDRNRVRRSSSKDIEEAMASGLGKADMYMPPI